MLMLWFVIVVVVDLVVVDVVVDVVVVVVVVVAVVVVVVRVTSYSIASISFYMSFLNCFAVGKWPCNGVRNSKMAVGENW